VKDRKPKNPTASVRQRLQNLGRKTGEPFQTLLTRYALERLLFRLTQSPYKDKFILKGSVLFAIWTGEMHRPTKDLDLLGSGKPDQTILLDIFHAVASMEDADDGLTFLPDSVAVHRIREEQEYGGLRITLMAKLGNSRIPLQIDVGFGDAVTPAAEVVELPTLLSMSAPAIRAYPKETVVAEKYHAMVLLGMANSRMKDFFDLWVLCRTFTFAGRDLCKALLATFRRRKTELPAETPVALTETFANDAQKQAQWKTFISRSDLSAKAALLADTIALLRAFLLPPSQAGASKQEFDQTWPPQGPWQPDAT
jgi:predicted nucleotidyltransferase component of viral defense system